MHILLIWGPRGIYIGYRCSCFITKSGYLTEFGRYRPENTAIYIHARTYAPIHNITYYNILLMRYVIIGKNMYVYVFLYNAKR